ncbi:hypothetical protein EYZ11_008415 [Aspergillus tanneri]|uniref:Uncharacterized protein n=1 Tax=Aspergillus tanneri TaxID=1220188 RepID=A0A4S3JAQ4_9EURO|nr:hypothetical protein EYZ11_008415 [Aspergillus tanneri]
MSDYIQAQITSKRQNPARQQHEWRSMGKHVWPTDQAASSMESSGRFSQSYVDEKAIEKQTAVGTED